MDMHDTNATLNDAHDYYQKTPTYYLNRAIKTKKIDAIKKLLANDAADINWVDENGNTLLHNAASVNQIDNADNYILFLLLEAITKKYNNDQLGYYINRKTYYGETALHLVTKLYFYF